MGFFSSPSRARSMTTMRFGTPICTAASPMPGASYMVSSMSSMILRTASVTSVTGGETCRNIGSGSLMISRMAMGST